MSWLLSKLVPAPHLIDPKETRESSRRYFSREFGLKQVEDNIARQKRSLEHEQAILEGMESARADITAELEKRAK